MALKPTPPGATGVGTNQPTRGAGLTEEEEQEQKFLAKKLEEEEKAGEKAVGTPATSFSITNNGTDDLDLYQLAVGQDGMIVQRYMGRVKPRGVLSIDSPINALRFKAPDPTAVNPAQMIHGFPA